jgi:hypothetical protein
LTALVCSTLEGLWSDKPRSIDRIVPYFAAGGPRAQSGEDMAARMMMLSKMVKGSRTRDPNQNGPPESPRPGR